MCRPSSDLIWNYISVGVTAICGATFSIIISIFYPESILGRFNTVYSYYIVMSQFCVCGIHMAVVKFSAESNDDATGILIKSLIITAIISCFSSGVFYCLVNFVFCSIIGKSMVDSFNTILLALILFSLNKVFLGWLNGSIHMKAYAFFQAIRNAIIALSLICFSLYHLNGEKLTYCFLVSETIVAILSVIYILVNKLKYNKTEIKYKDLLWFGIRILPSNAVVELNTKIDVICLSIVLHNESIVGIYSFAAMFVEGFYQLLIVIRKIINPKIAVENIRNSLGDYIREFKYKYMKYVYIFLLIAHVILSAGYIILVRIIGKFSYYSGIIVIIIVCASIVANSKMIIFGNILSQTGNPGTESMINIISTFSNGILNIVFIWFYGMIGAAIATGISYFVFSILQRIFLKHRIDVVL